MPRLIVSDRWGVWVLQIKVASASGNIHKRGRRPDNRFFPCFCGFFFRISFRTWGFFLEVIRSVPLNDSLERSLGLFFVFVLRLELPVLGNSGRRADRLLATSIQAVVLEDRLRLSQSFILNRSVN
mmetsp:Transcript_24262/g.56225  ORF Transcript_24262/g.56225 Transcript_24262/m.56225 type:complete len:126 (-) Transcript_24262:235-612(-)